MDGQFLQQFLGEVLGLLGVPGLGGEREQIGGRAGDRPGGLGGEAPRVHEVRQYRLEPLPHQPGLVLRAAGAEAVAHGEERGVQFGDARGLLLRPLARGQVLVGAQARVDECLAYVPVAALQKTQGEQGPDPQPGLLSSLASTSISAVTVCAAQPAATIVSIACRRGTPAFCSNACSNSFLVAGLTCGAPHPPAVRSPSQRGTPPRVIPREVRTCRKPTEPPTTDTPHLTSNDHPRPNLAYQVLLAHRKASGTLPTGMGEVVVQGEDLGAWIVVQRAGWDKLVPAHQWLLESVGVDPDEEGPVRPVVRSQADRWETNLAAARQHHAREGHLHVPRKHVELITADGGRDGTDGEGRGSTTPGAGPPTSPRNAAPTSTNSVCAGR